MERYETARNTLIETRRANAKLIKVLVNLKDRMRSDIVTSPSPARAQPGATPLYGNQRPTATFVQNPPPWSTTTSAPAATTASTFAAAVNCTNSTGSQQYGGTSRPAMGWLRCLGAVAMGGGRRRRRHDGFGSPGVLTVGHVWHLPAVLTTASDSKCSQHSGRQYLYAGWQRQQRHHDRYQHHFQHQAPTCAYSACGGRWSRPLPMGWAVKGVAIVISLFDMIWGPHCCNDEDQSTFGVVDGELLINNCHGSNFADVLGSCTSHLPSLKLHDQHNVEFNFNHDLYFQPHGFQFVGAVDMVQQLQRKPFHALMLNASS